MTTLPQTTSVRLPQGATPAGVPAPYGAAPVGAQASATMTGADIWRIVRANLWLILLILVMAGAAGYGANILLMRYYPKYTARGLVQVPQSVQTGSLQEVRDLPNERIITEQRTQAQIMTTERLFSEALQNAEIRATGWFKDFAKAGGNGQLVVDSRAAKKSLDENFRVTPVPDSSLLSVTMTYSDPKDAQTIVREIVGIHLEQQRALNESRLNNQTKSLKAERDRRSLFLEQIQKRARDRQMNLTQKGLGGPGVASIKELELREWVVQSLKLSDRLGEAQAAVDRAKQLIQQGQPLTEIDEKIDNDMQVVSYQRQISEYQIQKALQEITKGPESREIQFYSKAVEETERKLRDRQDELRIKYRDAYLNQLEGMRARTQAELEEVNKRIDALKGDLTVMSGEMALLKDDQEQEKTVRERYQRVDDRVVDIESAAAFQMQSRLDWAPNGQPERPENPTFPRLPITMAVALVLGLGLGLGIAFLREWMDDTVRSPRDLSRVGPVNLLGIVADENDDPQVADARLPIFDAPHSLTAEQFRQVRTRLQHAASLDTMRSMMVTGPGPMDGKTTIASNLAAGLALNGRKILLVDGNFRRPEIHRVFGFANDRGFSDVLNGTAAFEDVVHETRVPNLSVMTSGPKPMNPTELFESQLFADFLERAGEDYDHVIFDSGPILVVSESVAMAPRVDGVVTVIRAHEESRGLLLRMRDTLRQIKAEHVGVVLNAVRAHGGGYYRRNIKTYYEYQAEA